MQVLLLAVALGLFIFLAGFFHEFGHYFAIRRYGFEIIKIHFNPLTAGVTWDDRFATEKQRRWIMSAGMIANVIAMILFGLLNYFIPFVLFEGVAIFNFALLAISVLPVKQADGYKLFNSFTN